MKLFLDLNFLLFFLINVSDGSRENEAFFTVNSNKFENTTGSEFIEKQLKLSHEHPVALFPASLDAALGAEISANATCGTTAFGSEEFCKWGGSMQCSICSGSGGDILKKHSIGYAIDSDTSNWWQSPTLEQGPQYEFVTVTLDLRQVIFLIYPQFFHNKENSNKNSLQPFYIWYFIMKCANSPRPESWILERSLDGIHFSVWQYFVASADDCWDKYRLPAITEAAGSYEVQSDNETLCTTFYSKVNPLEGGEVRSNLQFLPNLETNFLIFLKISGIRFYCERSTRLRFRLYHSWYTRAQGFFDREIFTFSIPKIQRTERQAIFDIRSVHSKKTFLFYKKDFHRCSVHMQRTFCQM